MISANRDSRARRSARSKRRALHQTLYGGMCAQGMAQPGQVIPHQQVDEILVVEVVQEGEVVLGDLGIAQGDKQLTESRVGVDHARGVGAQATAQQLPALVRVFGHGAQPGEQFEQRVGDAAAVVQPGPQPLGIVCELFEQYRGEVDHHTHCRVRLEMCRHVAVVLERMQVDPGQGVVAVKGLAVPGLVHVPAEYEAQAWCAHLTRARSADAGPSVRE